jgi:hypothetical protein
MVDGAAPQSGTPTGAAGSSDTGALSEIANNGKLFNQLLNKLTDTLSGFASIILPVANGGTGRNDLSPAHGILIGEGTSPVNITAAMTNGQLLVGATGADPAPQTMSGDATLAASGALTIANNAVTNAKMATMAQSTIKGRAVGAGTGDPTDLSVAQLLAIVGNISMTIVIGNGSTAIATGLNGQSGIYFPFGATLTAWTLTADASGSIVIDVWKDTYANFPPTNADSITNGHEPALSAAQKAQDTNITDWTTTTINADDVLYFNVDSASTVKQVTLTFTMTKTS